MTGSNLQLYTLLAQLLSATAMAAVIWFVQIVTYPQFLEVGESQFRSYHESYSTRVSFIVIPPMFLELGASFFGVYLFWDQGHLRGWMIAGAVITALAWLCTFAIQVPLHTRLMNGFSREAIVSLVQTNWIRTVLWTIHPGIVIIALQRWMSSSS